MPKPQFEHSSVLRGNSRTCDKFVIRLPDGMKHRIQDAALGGSRSMNSEIIARLEESLKRPSLQAALDSQWVPCLGMLIEPIDVGSGSTEGPFQINKFTTQSVSGQLLPSVVASPIGSKAVVEFALRDVRPYCVS